MNEAYRYFLYLLIGKSKGAVQNLRNASFPSNVRILDFAILDKFGYKYAIVTFEADQEETAQKFASYLKSFGTSDKQSYLLPGLYKVEKL